MLMLSLWYTLSLANKTDIGHLLKHFYVFLMGKGLSNWLEISNMWIM